MRRTVGLLAIAAALAISPRAWADPRPDPEAMRHFLQGKRLRDEGRCADAIDELQSSVGIEPSIGAYYNLGVCSEKLGRNREALLHYDRALALAKERGDDREREIRAQRAEFLEKTPHLRLALTFPLPPGLRITVNGELVPSEDFQGETLFFPSRGPRASYQIFASASGYESAKSVVGEDAILHHDLVQIVLKESAPFLSSPSPAVASAPGSWTWQHWTGAGAGVVGLLTLGVAGYLGVDYLVQRPEIDRRLNDDCLDGGTRFKNTAGCAAGTDGRARAQRAIDDNNDLENRVRSFGIGTAIVGGVLVAGGVVLFVTAPSSNGSRGDGSTGSVRLVPIASAKQPGVVLTGTF